MLRVMRLYVTLLKFVYYIIFFKYNFFIDIRKNGLYVIYVIYDLIRKTEFYYVG